SNRPEMLRNEKLSAYCKKCIEQALVRDLVGPELALDHAGAGRLVSGHCIKAANPTHRLYRPGGTRATDCATFDQSGSRSIAWFVTRPASNCSAVNPNSGCRHAGAISASGASTNWRS